MAKQRAEDVRYFIIEAVEATTGNGNDDDGNVVTLAMRLDIEGRWSHGQRQTLHLVTAVSDARLYAELLIRTADEVEALAASAVEEGPADVASA